VTTLPVCTRPLIPVSASSAEIDRAVKDRLSAAGSVYEVDAALICDLNPTHIITQTQCKVCAVSLDDVERSFQGELGTTARVISLEPYALRDVFSDIHKVAKACGRRQAGEDLVAELRSRIRSVKKRITAEAHSPTVAALEWLEPLMAGGNWVPELIELAGGRNLFGVAGQHSPWMTWDDLVTADPDVIVALPCGFDLARTVTEMHWLTDRPGWRNLRAVISGRVFVCDGNQFMNRPGPRLVESLQAFAEMLHPDLFLPELEHRAWQRFL
jgi:iron complex transport system substrate-binding protein